MRIVPALTGTGLGFCLLVVVAACSGGFGPVAHHPLIPLNVPRAARLPAFSHVAPATDADQIYSMNTFVANGERRAQALVAVDGDLYVTNLDGSGKRRIGLTYPCFDPAVTPDGAWTACPNQTDESNNHDELQVVALRPNANGGVRVVHLQPGGFYVHPTWSPDGRELAIVRDRDNTSGGCSIDIYAARPPYDRFTQRVELTSQAFTFAVPFAPDERGCALGKLSWSPDGQNLAVQMGKVALLPIKAVLASLPLGQSTPPTKDVPPAELTVIASSGLSVTWNPQTGQLTYLDAPHLPQRILVYDPTTHTSTSVVTVPSVTRAMEGTEQVEWLAWTPDGRHLLFVVNEFGYCTDCRDVAPSDVYSLTT